MSRKSEPERPREITAEKDGKTYHGHYTVSRGLITVSRGGREQSADRGYGR